MLEVNQLSRCYGHFQAVDSVSFSIKKGEIVGLLGHNGAGKTTIMKMISGYLEPNQGTIKVDGLNLTDNPKAVQAGLGYLPENLPVYPEMTVADYLDYAADLKGLTGQTKQDEIKRAVKATDIANKLLDPIATLSRGYKQRVGVAQAILGKPKLLILDEPTNGLDPEQTQHMRQLIREIAQHATVILSTHIMQEVDALCSRVLILRSGKLAVDAKLAELRQSNHLLLETSLSPIQLELVKVLSGIDAITPIQAGDSAANHYRYRITLTADHPMKIVAPLVAKTIVENNQQLFALTPELRDLESLFREVNDRNFTQEGLNHAA